MKYRSLTPQSDEIYLLDGAMGTELTRRGIPLPPPLWTAAVLKSHKNDIIQIHKQYREAGADILTSLTFRSTLYANFLAGKSQAEAAAKEQIQQAVDYAFSASENQSLIAGSVAPVADCYEPDSFPGDSVARESFDHLIENLIESGVDILLFETFNSLHELEIALEISAKYTVPVWISVLLKSENTLLNGDSLSGLIELQERYNTDACLINCSSPELINKSLETLLNSIKFMSGAYANLGLSNPLESSDISETLSPNGYGQIALTWKQKGLKIIGACCGSTPDHIKYLNNILK